MTDQVSRVVSFVESEELITKVPIGRVADLQRLAGAGGESAEGVSWIGGRSFHLLKKKTDWRHDSRHDDTRHNDIQHKRLSCDTQYKRH